MDFRIVLSSKQYKTSLKTFFEEHGFNDKAGVSLMEFDEAVNTLLNPLGRLAIRDKHIQGAFNYLDANGVKNNYVSKDEIITSLRKMGIKVDENETFESLVLKVQELLVKLDKIEDAKEAAEKVGQKLDINEADQNILDEIDIFNNTIKSTGKKK